MKWIVLPFALCVVSCALNAEEGEKPAPAYVDEAPMPEGWPKPGPYNQVAEKSYPAYRAAFTTDGGENRAFWTLFSHIKKRDIPMTAPVEMAMEPEARGGMKSNSMGFLYQNTAVGTPGKDGENVEIRDVAAGRALSYAWQGPDSEGNIATAKAALEASLAEKKITPKGFRLLGYNGPRTPNARKTWELQALLD
jgi:hypothetical protein